MTVLTSVIFDKAVKKLHSNEKSELDAAVRYLISNPAAGEIKRGDLSGVRVYKFKMINQLTLLAYIWEKDSPALTLLALVSHENFYRDIKRGL